MVHAPLQAEKGNNGPDYTASNQTHPYSFSKERDGGESKCAESEAGSQRYGSYPNSSNGVALNAFAQDREGKLEASWHHTLHESKA